MYENVILSALNNWYLDVTNRRTFGSHIGIVAASERKPTSRWTFEETSCFFGEDFSYPSSIGTSRCSPNANNEEVTNNEPILRPRSGQFLYSITNVANGQALTAINGELWMKHNEDLPCQRWFRQDSRIVSCEGKVIQVQDVNEPITLAFYDINESKQKWSIEEEYDEADQVLIISSYKNLRLDPIGNPYWKPNGVQVGAFTALEGANIDVQLWKINFATVVDDDDNLYN